MILFFIVSLALSQENNRSVKYEKTTEIDFEAIDITGELIKPQGMFIQDKDKAIFNPLIEIRYDWDQEMSESVREIK